MERYSRPGIEVPQNLLDGAGGVTLGVGPVCHQRGEVEAGSRGHWMRDGLILGGWSACVGAAGAGGVDESLHRYLSGNHSHGGDLEFELELGESRRPVDHDGSGSVGFL